jgi:hypothetical protein
LATNARPRLEQALVLADGPAPAGPEVARHTLDTNAAAINPIRCIASLLVFGDEAQLGMGQI